MKDAQVVKEVPKEEEHPMEKILRMDRIPHIWCPTCGIGTAVTAFATALDKTDIPLDNICVVSGIGCSGRIAGYVKLDSFHSTHGRAIPFATGLKLGNPKLKLVVFSGDGDIAGIGGNHLIHAARRNMDMVVLCINNFIYAMTGGQAAATTPLTANTSTSPYGCYEQPFNLPHLAASCGAVYVARWTCLHIRRLAKSIEEALKKRGFSFIEIIAPCSTIYARRNRLGDGLSLMKFYHDNSVIKHGADTRELGINYQKKIIVGKFVDIERPTFLDSMNEWYRKQFGEKYIEYGGPSD
jgi:2-oxoglutarate ferredoxin oxidoreductase subunit beta